MVKIKEMEKKYNNVAVITARGGSKRIPRKNIKDFMGKPMIAYAIETAKKSGLFSEIMVSTEDQEIADIARKFGATVPFMRSQNTANDVATTFDVLDEVVSQYEEKGQVFDNLCCIYPCVPLLKPEHIVSAYNKFSSSGDVDSLVPAVRFSFPIQRAFVADADGLLSYREPEYKNFRSQDLEPTYHDAGMFYWYRWGYFSKVKEHAVLVKTAMYEMEEKFVQDIDNQSDWDMAELKYRILKELDK